MKVFHKKIHKVTILAEKGKVFSKEKFVNSNLLTQCELNTLEFQLGGKAISWKSVIDFTDIEDEQWTEWFSPLQIDA